MNKLLAISALQMYILLYIIVIKYTHFLTCVLEILLKEDLLPYAQHLLNSRSYNKPMPVMFTLTAEDMWPVCQIKLIINQMAGFDAKHRIPMAIVHQELSAIASVNMEGTYYPR